MRKFEVLAVSESPGGPGPDKAWRITYQAIQNKIWVEKHLWIIARNKTEAKNKAMSRYGDK